MLYRAFGYDYLSPEEIQQMYSEARMMDEQHGHEFTGNVSSNVLYNTVTLLI